MNRRYILISEKATYIVVEETSNDFMCTFLQNINHIILSIDSISRVVERLFNIAKRKSINFESEIQFGKQLKTLWATAQVARSPYRQFVELELVNSENICT